MTLAGHFTFPQGQGRIVAVPLDFTPRRALVGKGEATLRFLVNEDGSMHPAGTACAAFTWLVEDKTFVKRITIADKVYACVFAGEDKSTVVIVPDWNHHGAYTPPPDTKTTQFYDLYGNRWPSSTPVGNEVLYASSNLSAAELANALKP